MHPIVLFEPLLAMKITVAIIVIAGPQGCHSGVTPDQLISGDLISSVRKVNLDA
jgi:hypothetical protein